MLLCIRKMKDRNENMTASIKRGYSPDDENDFKGNALETMKRSANDLHFLLNRGYQIKGASTFIGNHYQLTERQRIALTRIVSSENSIAVRT